MRLWVGSWGSFTLFVFFFFNDTATTEIYTLSLHDALPISMYAKAGAGAGGPGSGAGGPARSEEHMSELQSPKDLVCRLLLEKKKKKKNKRLELKDIGREIDRSNREATR